MKQVFRESPILKDGKIIRIEGLNKRELKRLSKIKDENELKDFLSTLIHTRILKESFMREWKDYINFSDMAIWQDLSEEFMREFCLDKDDVMFAAIGNNKNITPEFEKELRKRFGM